VWRANLSRDDPRAAEEARQQVTARSGVSTLRVLLGDAIDYAGLFPPAQLDMAGAVAEYAGYLDSDDRWALGKFVVPVGRLHELREAALSRRGDGLSLGPAEGTWRLSALVGADVSADMARVRAFNAQQVDDEDWSAQVEAIEVRASTEDAVAAAARAIGDGFETYVEIPIVNDPAALVRAIAAAGLRAKIRTGGTTADAFPAPGDVARFLSACIAAGVPFKATAGLHHPVRGEHALTYAPDSPLGTMHGFLNMLVAAACLASGGDEAQAREILEDQNPSGFLVVVSGVMWRIHRLGVERLARVRASGMASFGSCSFREPLDDLAALGIG
jgi:hypothetical protein